MALGAIGTLAWNTLYIDGYGYGFTMTAFGYSLLAAAFALLVAAALAPGSWLARWPVPGAGPLARASYSLYLVHKPVAYWVHANVGLQGWTELLVVAAAALAAGALLHQTIEVPFLAWRDRIAAARPMMAGATP